MLHPKTWAPLSIVLSVINLGHFTIDDMRRKHKEIQKQFPDLDIRFVFQNSRAKLYKGAKSSYGDWCKKYGFKYADKSIPDTWLEE